MIVTGGSRGIGVAAVLALAGAGHDVAFSYRSDGDAAERVCRGAAETGARRSAHVVERPAVGALDEHPEQLSLAHALGERLRATAAQQAVGTVSVEGELSLRRSVDDRAGARGFLDDA
jgi:3-oxoacyl-[acyl-carrier protein] reductase